MSQSGRSTGPLPLQIVTKAQALTEVWAGDLAAKLPPGGAWALVEGGEHIPPEVLAPRLEGRVGGAPLPDWARGGQGAFRGDTAVCRVPEVFVLPGSGAVIDREGRVFGPTVGEALSWKPDLAALPFVRRSGEARLFAPPASLPRLAGATVFMAKGGAFNYGHFLLDCLPALLAVEEHGLTEPLPPIAPPLKAWQRDLLALAFPGLAVRETGARAVRLAEVAFSTAMNHQLHRSNALASRLRARVLAASPSSGRGPKRVYISRRSYPMRVMIDEPALEAALERRGFVIARTERLSAAEQIALVRDAQVMAGATGAGMANALFAPEGAKVFEVQPEGFTSWWLRDLVHLSGGDWYGWFCPAPTDPREVAWRYRIRRGFRGGYRVGVDDVLRFLDERM